MGIVGLVYYADDPSKTVFRKVLPLYHQGETEAVLDDPQWVTMGCDPNRKAVMLKVSEEELAKYAPWPKIAWEPTPPDALAAMLELAQIMPTDVVMDLGCGDGRVLLAAIQEGANFAIGIDLDEERLKQAAGLLLSRFADRVRLRHENLFQTDLSCANVILLYLDEVGASAIALETAKPGTRIVTYNSAIRQLSPVKSIAVSGGTVELYVVS